MIEKWGRVDGTTVDKGFSLRDIFASTFPVDDGGTRCVSHLRRRLAPGRLTAMCHDRRTNAGNLQFSFALIDHAVASKSVYVSQATRLRFNLKGAIFFFSPPCQYIVRFFPLFCRVY